MAKNLKLTIKNTQIAEAINLGGLKSKLAKKKQEEPKKEEEDSSLKSPKTETEEMPKEEAPRIRARSRSAFAEPADHGVKSADSVLENSPEEIKEKSTPKSILDDGEETVRAKTSAELRNEIFGKEIQEAATPPPKEIIEPKIAEPVEEPKPVEQVEKPKQELPKVQQQEIKPREERRFERPSESRSSYSPPVRHHATRPHSQSPRPPFQSPRPPSQAYGEPKRERPAPEGGFEKLGPTGKHIKDFVRTRPAPQPHSHSSAPPQNFQAPLKQQEEGSRDRDRLKAKVKPKEDAVVEASSESKKATKFKDFKDVKPVIKRDTNRQFDARDRQGLRASDEDQQWRKKRHKQKQIIEDTTVRPTSLKVRLPISIKDLASEMKLKASQLVGKLFLQGTIVTLNDLLEDEVTVQLLGHEFGCEITIDTSEQERIRITDQSIKEELLLASPESLRLRPPVVAFMGHVDHGKTSLIDAIRKSNRAAGEAGAITQHIGAFKCTTPVGDIAILDTPGHEAFSAMRARGADVTDIVVLVVAGDEGLRQQTIEAIQHARAANVVMVVAINKSDKPNFNQENVYRQLADNELLPEAWGGQTITVNCSAVTGAGIKELLEMLALQAEVLELRANPDTRARGRVLESEMHKGMGAVATVLVQNGTLQKGDAIVFGRLWGRVKTMHDEYGKELQSAGPSTPVEITGLSGLPEAGDEFIVVKNEKEAREIAEVRSEDVRQSSLLLQQKKKMSLESLLQASAATGKKILNVVLRADVQGSLEALKAALLKVHSEKAEVNLIFTGIGEVSESDVQLAAASRAVIIGFHTQIESHAEILVKDLGVQVKLHDIIYHAVDDVKLILAGLLERIAVETEKGKVMVKATFKSSHAGVIAGCQVIDGTIHRNHQVRVKRENEVVWKGTIASLKRVKDDVREVTKGLECGILLNNFSDIRTDDIIEAYEITYIAQEL